MAKRQGLIYRKNYVMNKNGNKFNTTEMNVAEHWKVDMKLE